MAHDSDTAGPVAIRRGCPPTTKRSCSFDLSAATLAERAVLRGEGRFASNGAVVVYTGKRTGRSPQDRFIVCEPGTAALIDWGAVNQPVPPPVFEALWRRVQAHIARRETFTAELHVGAHSEHYLPIRVTTEYAWHALFAQDAVHRPGTPRLVRPRRQGPSGRCVSAAGLRLPAGAGRHPHPMPR